MKLRYREKGVFSIFNQIETATKSLISKMKLAKTEITKHATKKSIITTVTSISLAGAISLLSVFEVFGAQDIVCAESEKTVSANLLQKKSVVITIPTNMGAQSPIVEATESLDEIIEGYAVFIDGKEVGLVSERGKLNIESHLSKLTDEFVTDGKAEIFQDIAFKKGLFDAVSIISSNTVISQNKFDVVEVITITDTETIPFETVYENSNKLEYGKTKVSVEGVDGEITTVTEIRYLDGKEISNEVVKTEKTDAVNKVVLNGTKRVIQLSQIEILKAGGIVFPLADADYFVSSDFGYRSFDSSFHDGIDYAADYGTPVYSAWAGKVVFADWSNDGYGNYVIVEHANGYTTAYAHLAEINVSRGDIIPAGRCVGTVGSTGYSTGNHLHFSVKKDGEFTNPAQFY